MSYIKDTKHFINYLNKVVRENLGINQDELMSGRFYIEEIYQAGLGDEYTWALKQEGAHLLEEQPVLKWLQKQRTEFIREERFDHLFSDEFVELAEDLTNLSGVYSFWRDTDTCLYVGRSIRLGERILSSFRDHFRNYDRPIDIRYIHTNSAPDAAILELYFITTLNPPLNRRDNFATEELTLTVEPIPKWSEPVRCNIIMRGKQNG